MRRRPGLRLLLALLLAALGGFHAEAATTGPSCSTSMGPQHLPLPSCAPSNKSVKDAKAIAWQKAPIVHWHPLEPWTLQVRGPAGSMQGRAALCRMRQASSRHRLRLRPTPKNRCAACSPPTSGTTSEQLRQTACLGELLCRAVQPASIKGCLLRLSCFLSI